LIQHRAGGGATDSLMPISLMGWLDRAVWQFAIGRHTLAIAVLSIAWLVQALLRRFTGSADRLAGLLLAWAMVHVLVGRQGVYQHEWWWWPLTPGVVIASALAIDQILTALQTRGRFPVLLTNAAATLSIVAFAAWNVRAVLVELNHPPTISATPLNYTPAEFGQFIRQHVPPDAAVMLAESDSSLALWYYADRAMKRHVWDPPTLQTRLADGSADLSFDVAQPWNGKVTSIIVPRAYAIPSVQPLLTWLDERYPRTDAEKFIHYDLTHPRMTTP
jgi:hypothetical protein